MCKTDRKYWSWHFNLRDFDSVSYNGWILGSGKFPWWKTWSRNISWGRVFHSFKFFYRLYTAANQYRTNRNGTVWLNAGDFFQVSSLIANNCFCCCMRKPVYWGRAFLVGSGSSFLTKTNWCDNHFHLYLYRYLSNFDFLQLFIRLFMHENGTRCVSVVDADTTNTVKKANTNFRDEHEM